MLSTAPDDPLSPPSPRPAKRRRPSSSLRTRVALSLAILIFGTAGILGGIIGESSVRVETARIGQGLATDATRIAERLNSEMATRARELTLLAALDPLRTLAAAEQPGANPPPPPDGLARVRAILTELKRSYPDYQWIGVTDQQGRVIAATDAASLGADIATRLSSRDAVVRARAGITGGGSGPTAAVGVVPRLIDVTHPILGAGGVATGLIVGQLQWEWIRSLSAKLLNRDPGDTGRGELFIVSAQDIVLVGPPNTIGQKLGSPVVNRARAGFTGGSVESWPAIGAAPAGEYLTGTGFSAGEGNFPGPGSQEMKWSVLVREPIDVALAPAYALRRQFWSIGGILALVFAGIGWLIANWISKPMRRIAIAAERLRQGDDVEIPRIRGSSELESMSSSLRALIATLTRKQVALDEMQDLALHDPLTGLLNRNGMRVNVLRAVTEARAEGSALLICVGDLDGFKAVNDTLGHAGGDVLLRQVATRLSGAVRQDDIVARLGGDEFVLALRSPGGFSDAEARGVAERALRAISAPYEINGRAVRIGCSIGCAVWPDHSDPRAAATDPAGLGGVLEKADAALYAVKRAEKGRLYLHGADAVTA